MVYTLMESCVVYGSVYHVCHLPCLRGVVNHPENRKICKPQGRRRDPIVVVEENMTLPNSVKIYAFSVTLWGRYGNVTAVSGLGVWYHTTTKA